MYGLGHLKHIRLLKLMLQELDCIYLFENRSIRFTERTSNIKNLRNLILILQVGNCVIKINLPILKSLIQSYS